VIHWYDHGLFRIPVHDPFQTNFLSSHNNNNLPPSIAEFFLQMKKGSTDTRNKSQSQNSDTRTYRFQMEMASQKCSYSCNGQVLRSQR
jgi:hypothetical protein